MAEPGRVTTYPFPAELPSSETYRVTAGGKPVFVIRAGVADVACFACSGAVDVAVEVTHDVARVEVRPLRHGIRPAVAGRTLRFRLPGPCKLSLEVNGDIKRPLLLFADAPEKGAPKPGAPGVRFLEGGKVHDLGEITLKSGETLYLAPGAVVRGTVTALKAKRVRVCGRGVFDAGPRQVKSTFFLFKECRDVALEDVLVLDSYGWTVVPWQSEKVRIRNIKLVSGRDNDDGIDPCACTDVRIDNCFLRTKDDCVSIKAHGDRSGAFDVRGVRVTRCVVWNAEWGNAMEIGFELRAARVSDVLWQDCDIIHVETGAVFSIHNADFATVENVRFENIRVEDARDKLVDLHVGLAIYSQDCPKRYSRLNPQRQPVPGSPWVPLNLLTEEERAAQAGQRGRIRRVTFRNIQLLGEKMPISYVLGFGEKARVEDVLFEGVSFHGEKVRDAAALKLQARDAVGVRFGK